MLGKGRLVEYKSDPVVGSGNKIHIARINRAGQYAGARKPKTARAGEATAGVAGVGEDILERFFEDLEVASVTNVR